jgi:DNA polymerase-2
LKPVRYTLEAAALQSFAGTETLLLLRFADIRGYVKAGRILEEAGVPSPERGMKPAEAFLAGRFIRGPILIRGPSRPGRSVGLVFPDPELEPALDKTRVKLKIASIDIETDTRSGAIRAVAVAFADSGFGGVHGCVRVVLPPGQALTGNRAAGNTTSLDPIFYPDEAALLRAFIAGIQQEDPDILTGWNFLDFDFPRLADRAGSLGIPFALGRSPEPAKFFAGEGRRSAAALTPGRQVLDALRIIRSGPERFPDYTLQTVAESVLGEGKLVESTGTEKIEALDRLYADDPVKFGSYCYTDAELVLRILSRTGLFALTVERAALTGVFLDKAWTSVVSFEHIYGMELRRNGIAPDVPPPANLQVSGAAGGTVLESRSGLFRNIAVFDFRSLYPTIIRSFNIDPRAHALAAASDSPITAPNGAAFSRDPGILPQLIGEYFEARRKAIATGDSIAAHVYKILMNSFYGVLGTGSCRYGRTELAGAITSFARKWLLFSRDWFTVRGREVLYGDTDSLFVDTGLPGEAAYEDFAALCGPLARDLNAALSECIREEYGLESTLELRFEKAYRQFIIPPLRGMAGARLPGAIAENAGGHEAGAIRGRAKGYAGYMLKEDGSPPSVEVKGMEAVRSDTTPLARRIQLELLDMVFSGDGEAVFKEQVLGIIRELRSGRLDGELIYRKRLSRPPETYTTATPPQVKVARALGWKGRRGTVEFLWTIQGPEPVSMVKNPLDYDHYTDSQVLPVAESIALAAGWNAELFPRRGRSRTDMETGQLELRWDASLT